MSLSVYEPRPEDLWFRQQMLADEETMSYNHAWGGTVPFPEEDWADWYSWWIGEPGGKRFYRYVKDEDGHFVGEIAWHYDADIPGAVADVIIHARYRGKGYGGQALDLLCSAAGESGLTALYDNIAADNPAAALFLKHGFAEEYRTEEIIMLKKEL